jgi:RNA polymerase sigma factor (sigma-70 family)
MDLETEIEALAPRLLRYCLGRLGDRALAEEISQEALTALVDRWRRHGPPNSPIAFAFSVARRRAGRLVWKRKLLTPWDELLHGNRQANAPDDIYAPRERLGRTLAALETLTSGEREALLLVAVGEMNTTEAAEAQGVSRSAIKMRVHRARRKLLALVEESDDE